jgi:hypothetical protein
MYLALNLLPKKHQQILENGFVAQISELRLNRGSVSH